MDKPGAVKYGKVMYVDMGVVPIQLLSKKLQGNRQRRGRDRRKQNNTASETTAQWPVHNLRKKMSKVTTSQNTKSCQLPTVVFLVTFIERKQ